MLRGLIGSMVLSLCANGSDFEIPDHPIVITHVHVIPMNDEGVLTDHSLLIEGGRIVAMGPTGSIETPAQAEVIDGGGGYLMPGLTDAHVHLDPGLGSRPEFGDAPIYLAHGITSVINLRGDDLTLDWKRQIEEGHWVAPTIYTSGEFMDEPYVTTPEEASAEVKRQVDAGYDLIKHHEFWADGAMQTYKGMDLATYRAMVQTAHQLKIPIVGHAPLGLAFSEVLEQRQSLAHVNGIVGALLIPDGRPEFATHARASQKYGTWTAAMALAILILTLATRKRSHPNRRGAIIALIALAVAASLFGLVLERAYWAGHNGWILLLMSAVIVAASAAVALFVYVWTSPTNFERLLWMLPIPPFALLCPSLVFWLPLLWRNSSWGLEQIANEVRQSGVSVITTLVTDSREWFELPDRVSQYLSAEVGWRGWKPEYPEVDASAGFLSVSYWDQIELVLTAKLHQAAVPLVLGTDAMGIPGLPPGQSLLHELDLLNRTGLSPFECLKTGTRNPAVLLNREGEFGVVAKGARADLLLLDENPLEDLSALEGVRAVMVRGRWLDGAELQSKLEALREEAN